MIDNEENDVKTKKTDHFFSDWCFEVQVRKN
jgi:hypothetical protein